MFRKRYGFLFDEQIPAEKQRLQAQLKREKSSKRQEELQRSIQRLDQQLRTEQDTRKKERVERDLRRREKEAVAQGKRPFYLKQADKRKLLLVEKFKELKKTGRRVTAHVCSADGNPGNPKR